MSTPRLRQLVFGALGAASAVFVHLLPAPWQLEPRRPTAAAIAPTGPAPARFTAGPLFRRPGPESDRIVGVPVAVEPVAAPHTAGAAEPVGRSGIVQPTATPHPASPLMPGVKPSSAGLAPPARAPTTKPATGAPR